LPTKLLLLLIAALVAFAVLAVVFLLFPPVFLLLGALAVMGIVVLGIRQIAYALDRRMGGGRLR